MKKTFFVITAVFLLSNLVYAQAELPDPGTLPDSALYGLDKAFEAIGNAFTFGGEAKVERSIELAEERLAEAEAMTEKGKPEFVDGLAQEYEEKINEANEIASLAKEANTKEGLAALIAAATSQHLVVLDGVQERVPEQAKERIAAARERSIRGNQEALKSLAEEDPERSAEMAMDAAESRIDKARQAADEGESEEAQEAVEEYKEYARFGEEISAIAEQAGKDSSKVDEIVAKATAIHLTVRQDVLEKLPEEARAAIESAMAQAEIGKDNAVASLEEKGMPVPEEAKDSETASNIPESTGDATGNFDLLVSDAPADIDDFEFLVVELKEARIFKENGTFEQREISESIDLTQVVGEKSSEVLSTKLGVGTYNKVELYVDSVNAKTVNGTANVTVPSEKLQISKTFEVTEGKDISFVFDINVVKKGPDNNYNLVPVVTKSGVVGEDLDESEVEEVEVEIPEEAKDQIQN